MENSEPALSNHTHPAARRPVYRARDASVST